MEPLYECSVCGAIGFAERIEDHGCKAFLRDEGYRRTM